MKAMIQKDLRENLKLALIGLLIFSLLLLQAYQTCISTLTNMLTGNSSGQIGALQPLLATGLLTGTAFFCAIFGTALGWLQTRNEAHRDLWAFLIHRPVTRTEIFWGKTIAGLCLYAFGAGLPLAVLVAVVRTPGYVAAPFEWAMVVPPALIFFTGIAYYFAGLLTGLRQARWYASRCFGLGLAIATSFGVVASTVFWIPTVLIAVAVLILAAAAWGAYQSGGFYRGQPVAGRLALTVALTAGCGVALFASVGLLVNLVLGPLTHHPYVWSYYQMTRDGTIYKETNRDGNTEYADLDGHPLLDPKTGQKMEPKEFSKRIAYGRGVLSTLKYRNRDQYQYSIQNASGFFSLWNITDKTLWYLDRHGKLLGYDGQTRKFIGSLDPHGNDGKLASEPFLQRADSNYYNAYGDVPQKIIATAKTVYQVDFEERTLKPVFTLTNDEIGGYDDEEASYEDNHAAKNFLITTRKTVCLMDYDGRPIFALPYKPGYFEYPQVEISFLQPTNSSMNNFAVWFLPDYLMNKAAGWKLPEHILWIAPAQTVTKSADLPVLRLDEESSWPDKLATTLLPPPVHVEFDDKIYKSWNLLSYTLALVCSVIGWTLARRYNFSTRASIGWTLFIFLLGIAGLLTFMCVQEWPVREICTNCKKFRAVDRESCEHCEAPFSPPEKNGTEIFEPLAKV